MYKIDFQRRWPGNPTNLLPSKMSMLHRRKPAKFVSKFYTQLFVTPMPTLGVARSTFSLLTSINSSSCFFFSFIWSSLLKVTEICRFLELNIRWLVKFLFLGLLEGWVWLKRVLFNLLIVKICDCDLKSLTFWIVYAMEYLIALSNLLPLSY